MYPLALGDVFFVQQLVSGTGTFTGVDRGRARRVLNFVGGGQVRVAARNYGSAANSYTVQVVDPEVAATQTTVTRVGTAIKITLRRTLGAILATPEEVATAINTVSDPAFPLRAAASITTGVASAVAQGALSGGLDADRIDGEGAFFSWTLSNVNGGFFHFEHTVPVEVLEISFRAETVASPTVLNWYKCPLQRDFTPRRPSEVVVDEAIPLWTDTLTSTRASVNITDIRDKLMPNMALMLVTNLAGVARVAVQRVGRFPAR